MNTSQNNNQAERRFWVATATSRLARVWRNNQWDWPTLQTKLCTAVRTAETVAQYAAMSRDERGHAKDVGGALFGRLVEGRRKKGSVAARSCVNLDVDHPAPGFLDSLNPDFAAIVTTTHSSTPDEPRYRVVIPLARDVSEEEYAPCARRLAVLVCGEDMAGLDPASFKATQMMYFSSTPSDGEFVSKVFPGSFADPDELLDSYADWHDASLWPTAPEEPCAPEQRQNGHRAVSEAPQSRKRRAATVEPPATKNGVVGAFCRTYDIAAAIATFLPDVYAPCGSDRYTYLQGHVSGGLVVYNEGQLAYANNATDPTAQHSSNAFDLVRLHRFGHLDDRCREDTPATRRPSYKAMEELALSDPKVKAQIGKERIAAAVDDFADVPTPAPASTTTATEELWLSTLDYRKDGGIKSTRPNVRNILLNQEGLKGHIYYNLFYSNIMVRGSLPWYKAESEETERDWSDNDDKELRTYLEDVWHITGNELIADALLTAARRRQRDPLREYFDALEWDGTERLDELFIRTLDAPDTELTRAQTRKALTACVARIYKPGCKFDNCIVLAGKQGIGKSTVLRLMASDAYFNDSLNSIDNNQGYEACRYSWLIEIAEMAAANKAESDAVKKFISSSCDRYRPAYGRRMETYPRHCVFFGTTNDPYPLKGSYGNRRFWVMSCNAPEGSAKPGALEYVAENRDQLWAEAKARYLAHEPLYLPPKLEAQARRDQERYNESEGDGINAMLELFLETLRPKGWDTMNTTARRLWLTGHAGDPTLPPPQYRIERVCGAEFVQECLNVPPTARNYRPLLRRFTACMMKLVERGEWRCISLSRHTAQLYGRQRAFERIPTLDDDL